MNRLLAVLASGLILWSCGETPSRLGVFVDRRGVMKAMLGASPGDLARRELVPGTSIRQKPADVLDVPGPEMLVAMETGKGLEIRDAQGRTRFRIGTADYLTDFGAVPARDGASPELVLYTYPNRDDGGTFVVMTTDQRPLARWDEKPPPGRFDVSTFRGQPAIFYLQNDTVVVRSPRGEKLAAWPMPEGRHFRDVHALELG